MISTPSTTSSATQKLIHRAVLQLNRCSYRVEPLNYCKQYCMLMYVYHRAEVVVIQIFDTAVCFSHTLVVPPAQHLSYKW